MSNLIHCSKCGREHYLLESCIEEQHEGIIDKIPWWVKAGAGSAIALGVAGSLPATVTTLAASGALIGGTWIVMVLMPLGEYEKDWLARHPRTFMLLHVPMTVGVAQLGEGLLMAFGNLAGGVIATLYLLRWGHKRGIGVDGKKKPGYRAPLPSKTAVRAAQVNHGFWKGASWLFSNQSMAS